MNLVIDHEPILQDALKRASDIPDLDALRHDREKRQAHLDEAKRALMTGRGRSWFGRSVDVAALQRAVDRALAHVKELDARIAEAEWQRAALDEALPEVRAEAARLVGERLVAETRRIAFELDDLIVQLDAKLQEARAIERQIDGQFAASTVHGFVRLTGPLNCRGPILGVLRFWTQPSRAMWGERVKGWRGLLQECGIAR